MRKIDEIQNPTSCLNRAADDEIVFVLRAHDTVAPHTIREWCAERILTGKNKETDPEICSALADADEMERTRR